MDQRTAAAEPPGADGDRARLRGAGRGCLDPSFSDLLEHELGSGHRFEAVEGQVEAASQGSQAPKRLSLTPVEGGPEPIRKAVR
jgi:hypothetical protein